jgi:hypothetical protein
MHPFAKGISFGDGGFSRPGRRKAIGSNDLAAAKEV